MLVGKVLAIESCRHICPGKIEDKNQVFGEAKEAEEIRGKAGSEKKSKRVWKEQRGAKAALRL